jgi:hypothetical protein
LTLVALSGSGPVPETGLITAAEDWLWLRLQMTDDLALMAAELASIGEFDDTRNPFIAGQIKLICGEYESAARWFQASDKHVYENLHICLCLAHAGLINPLVITEQVLAFAIMVARAEPAKAVGYIRLLGDHYPNVPLKLITRLAVEMPKGSMLFEPIEGANPPIASCFRHEQDDILDRACRIAENRSLYGRAAKFYWLAARYDKVIEVKCRQLTQAIEGFIGKKVVEKARTLYLDLLAHAVPGPMEALRIVIGFAFARVMMDEKKPCSEIVMHIDQIEFFPRGMEDLAIYQKKFRGLDSLLRPIVPTSLKITLRALAGEYKELGQRADDAKKLLKDKSEALIALSGELDIPQDVQKELLDLDNELR